MNLDASIGNELCLIGALKMDGFWPHTKLEWVRQPLGHLLLDGPSISETEHDRFQLLRSAERCASAARELTQLRFQQRRLINTQPRPLQAFVRRWRGTMYLYSHVIVSKYSSNDLKRSGSNSKPNFNCSGNSSDLFQPR